MFGGQEFLVVVTRLQEYCNQRFFGGFHFWVAGQSWKKVTPYLLPLFAGLEAILAAYNP